MTNTLPREVKPENVSAGDVIEVVYPDDGGVRVHKHGHVAHITAHAGNRHFMTQQGAVLAVWAPGKPTRLKIILHKRIDSSAVALFDVG